MNRLTPILLAAVFVGEVLCSSHGPTARPVVLHSGYLADTPEVAAAKSAHLTTLSQSRHHPSSDQHVLHNGHIADTHEVAAAKAEHFNAVAKARAQGGYQAAADDSNYGTSGSYNRYGYDATFYGPTSKPAVLHDGHIADTHEVAAAKAEHFTAVAKARAQGGYQAAADDSNYGTSGSYNRYGYDATFYGPTSKPAVLHDGHIADTHEVAAAKAEHFAAVAKARAHGGYHGSDYSQSGIYANGYDNYGVSGSYNRYGYNAVFHGPTAKPAVLINGHIADTQEVAAAKAEHFAAVAKARAHGGDYSGHYAAGYDHIYGAPGAYGTHSALNGGLARPVLLPSGYLADTLEVAHAKQQHLHLLHSSRSEGYNAY